MKKITLALVSLMLVALSGCVSGSTVLTGEARPAITSSSVLVYDSPPAGAIALGFVTANSTASFSWDTAKVQCIAKLKEKAAAIGANGIVITNVDDSVWEGQKMQAKAIYVSASQK